MDSRTFAISLAVRALLDLPGLSRAKQDVVYLELNAACFRY